MSHRFLFVLLTAWPACADTTFYRDVLPILATHCQECHRPGEIGPMPLTTYRQTRPWARAIRDAAISRKMPPWFADPHYGKFSNSRTLTQNQIDTLEAWAVGGAIEGNPADAPPARIWPSEWAIGTPDATFPMPGPFRVPTEGELDYQYVVVPTGLKQDRWVRKVELRPGDRSVVHHAVVYIREPGSPWLRGKPIGIPFIVPSRDPNSTPRSDILFTYTPGSQYDEWPEGMAKLIPAGADLVFQMHYTPAGHAASDQSRVGVLFARERPPRRVLTLQLNDFRLFIPPGRSDYRVTVSGTLPNDATLLSLYPHMHLRGRSFEYAMYEPDGRRRTLLKVNDYDFYWQLTYRLADPLLLRAGTKLECVAVFDNSKNNPRNPDPEAFVRYGQQSTDEMMIGFFDVAVDAAIDKSRFFERR